jgi:hypothetical protein
MPKVGCSDNSSGIVAALCHHSALNTTGAPGVSVGLKGTGVDQFLHSEECQVVSGAAVLAPAATSSATRSARLVSMGSPVSSSRT